MAKQDNAAPDLGLEEFEEDNLEGLDRGDEVESDEPKGAEDEELETPEGGEEADDAEEPDEEGEPEGESDDEPESESDDEPDDEPKEPERAEAEKPQENRIPQSRFNDVNERRKAAERRAKQLEEQLKQHDPSKAVDFDFDAKEDAYQEAVLDGRKAEAMAIRREIRAAEQAAFVEMAKREAAQAREATKSDIEFEQTVMQLNEQYPVFDPNAEVYNQEFVDEAVELRDGFVSRGYTLAAATKKAALYVIRANGLDRSEEPEVEAEPEPERKPVRDRKPNIQKKLEQASRQPPKQRGQSGRDSKPAQVDDMTEDEFDALPESTKARLRGDIV